MSAADAREELEAAIWRSWPFGSGDVDPARVNAILAAADKYAAARVAEAEGRSSAAYERLTAEIMRGTP